MLKSLLLLARHPDLVADHLGGYATLGRAEISAALRVWVIRIAAFAIAALFVLIGLIACTFVLTLHFAGIAASSWALWSVPIVCALIAAVAAFVGFGQKPPPFSAELSRQLREDADVIQTHILNTEPR